MSHWPKTSRRVIGAAAIAIVCAALLPAVGFLWYVSAIPREEVSLDRTADGIVALTGGAERIGDAVELLASGHGRRLLITGVNPTTRSDELAGLIPKYQAMFACCIDLDYSAVNTIGNAVETRRWANERGFRSLIVVTSSYHMPRAMAELSHQLPNVSLIAYPVVTDRLRAEPWWSSPASARLMLSEYLKYVVAIVRMRLEPVARVALAGAHAVGRS